MRDPLTLLRRRYLGDRDLAARYVNVARTLHGRMVSMLAGPDGAKTWNLPDGTSIRTVRAGGVDMATIDVRATRRTTDLDAFFLYQGIAFHPNTDDYPTGLPGGPEVVFTRHHTQYTKAYLFATQASNVGRITAAGYYRPSRIQCGVNYWRCGLTAARAEHILSFGGTTFPFYARAARAAAENPGFPPGTPHGLTFPERVVSFPSQDWLFYRGYRVTIEASEDFNPADGGVIHGAAFLFSGNDPAKVIFVRGPSPYEVFVGDWEPGAPPRVLNAQKHDEISADTAHDGGVWYFNASATQAVCAFYISGHLRQVFLDIDIEGTTVNNASFVPDLTTELARGHQFHDPFANPNPSGYRLFIGVPDADDYSVKFPYFDGRDDTLRYFEIVHEIESFERTYDFVQGFVAGTESAGDGAWQANPVWPTSDFSFGLVSSSRLRSTIRFDGQEFVVDNVEVNDVTYGMNFIPDFHAGMDGWAANEIERTNHKEARKLVIKEIDPVAGFMAYEVTERQTDQVVSISYDEGVGDDGRTLTASGSNRIRTHVYRRGSEIVSSDELYAEHGPTTEEGYEEAHYYQYGIAYVIDPGASMSPTPPPPPTAFEERQIDEIMLQFTVLNWEVAFASICPHPRRKVAQLDDDFVCDIKVGGQRWRLVDSLPEEEELAAMWLRFVSWSNNLQAVMRVPGDAFGTSYHGVL